MRLMSADDNFSIYDTGLEGDILGRAEFGKVLSRVVEGVEDPLVIALDGKWGTGKSYFLQRWVGAHAKENEGKAQTIYFDAFENDYTSDPLVALITAISARLTGPRQSKLDSAKRIAMKLLRPVTKVGVSLATAGVSLALDQVLDSGVEALKEEANAALDEFWKREAGRKVAMSEFRAAIQELTKVDSQGVSAPLVIVVDELDRCRPDFALDVLEVIKHFFAVPNVHFILGVNVEALSATVSTRYGNGIDAVSYLQKFITFSMQLPETVEEQGDASAVAKLASFLGKRVGIPEAFLSSLVIQIRLLSNKGKISLRDVNKIVAMIAFLPKAAFGDRVYLGVRIATVSLLITKVVLPEIYKRLLEARLTDAEVLEIFDASKEKISQRLLDGNYNRDYDSELAMVCAAWRYICRNGVSDGSEDWQSIGTLFDNFGMASNVSKLPKTIQKDWLESFQIS